MAVAETTVARVAHLTRRLYRDGQRIENLGGHMSPLWDHLPKEDGWVGDGNYSWSVEYARNQAVGGSLATVLGNIGHDKGQRFTFTEPSEMYGAAKITGRALRSTKGKGLAVEDFGKLITRNIDSTVLTFKQRMAHYVYGSGSGKIGRRASLSGNTITLETPDDAKNFCEGQYIVSDAADGGGTVNAGQALVEYVDYDAGTVTVEDATDITGFADNDYLFNPDDYDAVPKGLEAWIPFTAPTVSDSFLGVNRFRDVIRLSGHRYDASSTTIKEGAKRLAAKMGRLQNAKGDRNGYINQERWEDLATDLGVKVERDEAGSAKFGYKAIVQSSALGDIRWYADPCCPVDRAWIIDPDTFFVKHLDKLPHVYADDGQEAVRDTATPSDAVLVWFRAWWAMGCLNPSRNGVMKLAT